MSAGFLKQPGSARKETDWKLFYKQVLLLVLPMALQNLMASLVSASDALMLGLLNQSSLSAVSLAGQVQFIMTLFFFGLTSGAAILTAQY